MKKDLEVINVPSDGRPDWYEGAFCLLFVYTRDNGNFILKGYRREVEKYLKDHYTHYFFYLSMWSHGQTRGNWNFWKDTVTIFEPSKSKPFKRLKYSVVKYNHKTYNHERVAEFNFKRLPKHWIPEFNTL
jgi:hypothetical protein